MRKGSEKKRSATVSDEKERSKSKTHAPIIQNAVKTPTPPHCAKDFTVATVGTISTFDAAQCCLGMKDLSTSLMCVKCFVSFYSAALLLRKSGKHFPQNLGFCTFCTKTLNSFKAVLRFEYPLVLLQRSAPAPSQTHTRARALLPFEKRIRSRSCVNRITQK